MPERVDGIGPRLPLLLGVLHLLEQIDDAGNVVVVDVTDHDHADRQRLISAERELCADLLQTWAQIFFVHALGPAVDDHQLGIVDGTVVQEQCVALFREHRFKTEDGCHFASPRWVSD